VPCFLHWSSSTLIKSVLVMRNLSYSCHMTFTLVCGFEKEVIRKLMELYNYPHLDEICLSALSLETM